MKPVKVAIDGKDNIKIPKMLRIKQHFKNEEVTNYEQILENDIKKIEDEFLNGKKIAITVGSRGITDIDQIIKSLVEILLKKGASPFIVPAMGSHGGATIEGQLEVLREYNITEEYLGVPIKASMDVVEIGALEDGTPIFCDQIAFKSDGIIVANKIKPHTDFKSDYESGLLKMMAIGLGNHKGASTLHSKGFDFFPELIPKVGSVFLKKAPILFGVAIIENAYDKILHLEIVPKDLIFELEKVFLNMAKENIAKILLSEVDVLIVEEIGKNISGSGMDANVTGRPGSGLNQSFDAAPIKKIIVLGVSKKSHGNGVGIGMADLTTIKCVNQIDFEAMYTNSLTATILNPSKIPMTVENDQEAILAAIKTCNNINFNQAKIVKIKNTLELHEIEVSESYIDEVNNRDEFEILSKPYVLEFNDKGDLTGKE
ncbi:MAG: nickel-dependent lactate racemase [Clostridia bacterium]|nr:nickel-dependent lactate racemase [Clostridia bacterium]